MIPLTPPQDLPEGLASTLEGCNGNQLREAIDYAQQLLGDRPPLTDAIESRDGETLVRTVDHEGYTIAIVERQGEFGGARGPFAYRVKWEPDIDDEGGQYRWHYLGKVYTDTGTAADD